MKKFAIAFIAYLSFCHFAQAATTALTQSLLEYEAITNFIGAPGFTTIGPDEFIVDIKRQTREIDVLGVVEYTICTRRVTANILNENENEHDANNPGHIDYLATLFVSPNPGIGPNIVTVLGIVKCKM